jgi:hypothetical protein
MLFFGLDLDLRTMSAVVERLRGWLQAQPRTQVTTIRGARRLRQGDGRV